MNGGENADWNDANRVLIKDEYGDINDESVNVDRVVH